LAAGSRLLMASQRCGDSRYRERFEFDESSFMTLSQRRWKNDEFVNYDRKRTMKKRPEIHSDG